MNRLEQLGFNKISENRFTKGELEINISFRNKQILRCADGKFAYENKEIMNEFYNNKEITQAIKLLKVELGFTKAGGQ